MKKSIITKYAFLLWVGLVILTQMLGACQKVELPNEAKTVEDAYRMIAGEWEWKETIIADRGMPAPVHQTPATENKTIHYVFKENLKSSLVETIDNVRTSTDYEYNITIEVPGGDGYGGTFFLTSTNANTEEKHLATFRFKDKNTLVFFLISPSVTSYYSRK